MRSAMGEVEQEVRVPRTRGRRLGRGASSRRQAMPVSAPTPVQRVLEVHVQQLRGGRRATRDGASGGEACEQNKRKQSNHWYQLRLITSEETKIFLSQKQYAW